MQGMLIKAQSEHPIGVLNTLCALSTKMALLIYVNNLRKNNSNVRHPHPAQPATRSHDMNASGQLERLSHFLLSRPRPYMAYVTVHCDAIPGDAVVVVDYWGSCCTRPPRKDRTRSARPPPFCLSTTSGGRAC